MTTWVPSAPRAFASAVPHYRHRAPYPPDLLARVAELCGLASGARLLDLGCGPGPLAVGFARLGLEVVAIDPEPAMLEAAAAASSIAGSGSTATTSSPSRAKPTASGPGPQPTSSRRAPGARPQSSVTRARRSGG